MAPVGRPRLYPDDRTKWRTIKRRQRTAAYRATRHRLQPAAPVACRQIGDLVTLYCGDALVIAPALQHVGAVVTDPPYGTHFDSTKPRRSKHPLQACSTPARWTTNIPGDDQPFDPRPWLSYPQVILWGATHYASRLPDRAAWLTWDKRDGSTPDDHADCEHAWTTLRGVNRLYRHKWRGIIRAGDENVVHGGKLHPAQKPVALMQWCVQMTTGLVLDPYMGSGTTGLACLRLGRPFVGIELDPAAFDLAWQRLAAAAEQLQLFTASPPAVP